jgi:hypothetical protein
VLSQYKNQAIFLRKNARMPQLARPPNPLLQQDNVMPINYVLTKSR